MRLLPCQFRYIYSTRFRYIETHTGVLSCTDKYTIMKTTVMGTAAIVAKARAAAGVVTGAIAEAASVAAGKAAVVEGAADAVVGLVDSSLTATCGW